MPGPVTPVKNGERRQAAWFMADADHGPEHERRRAAQIMLDAVHGPHQT